MKVLIAVDGSQHALSAVRVAARLLRDQDQVTLFFSAPKVLVDQLAVKREDLIARAQQGLAEGVFEEARKALPPTLASTAATIVSTQPPRTGILLAADETEADLIVLGARGRGPITRVLLGSVAMSVTRTAKIPVLVGREKEPSDPERPLRLLLTYDGLEPSRRAAEFVGRLNFPLHSVGHVMSVVESFYAGEIPDWLESQQRDPDVEAMSRIWVAEHEATLQRRRTELAELSRTMPEPFQGSEPIVVEGVPADKILERMQQEQTDLVICGAGGTGAIQRMLIGSTSDTLLTYATCSVLIVHYHEQP